MESNSQPPTANQLAATQQFKANDTAREMAVLFADIAGSTKLYESLGDTTAKRLIDEALDAMTAITTRHHGRVVKTIGDEIMCVFPNAENAFVAATDMQNKIDGMPEVEKTKRAIRIGFHAGAVLLQPDGDVFGDTVNVAARMAGVAKGMQIITTQETVMRLSPMLRVGTRPIAALAVKGKADDLAVAEVIWKAGDDLTMTAPSMVQAPAAELVLIHGARQIKLNANQQSASFGRDVSNDFVIADVKASRVHARVERRRDKFVIVDQSTNGTFVTADGEAEIGLRREELMLRSKGRIVFGHSAADDSAEAVRYELR